MPETRSIVALSDLEIADFFPGQMWQELQELLPGHRRIQVPLAQPEEWVKTWRETQPEILVSAWQTPPLNGPMTPADLKALRYVCYVPGSIRKLVPREVVEHGTIVTNWGNSIAATVAESTVMLIIMALRRASF